MGNHLIVLQEDKEWVLIGLRRMITPEILIASWHLKCIKKSLNSVIYVS